MSPSTAIHNIDMYEICMCPYTFPFLHTQIHVCTFSHGFVAHTQVSKHVQERALQPMEHTHKDTPLHAHVYLSEGFGLGNSFSRNRDNCPKEKNRAWGTAQMNASAYLHAHCGTCQPGFPPQLRLLQLSTCWVCFPWVPMSGEPHRDFRLTCLRPHVQLTCARCLQLP